MNVWDVVLANAAGTFLGLTLFWAVANAQEWWSARRKRRYHERECDYQQAKKRRQK